MLTLAIIILAISVALSLLRLVTAQSAADKVIAVDVLAFELLGLCILLALADDNPVPLQFGFILAMLGFISTLILSRLIHTSTKP